MHMAMSVTASPQIRKAQLLGGHTSRQVCADAGVIGSLQVSPDISTGTTAQQAQHWSPSACTSTCPAHPVREYFYSFPNQLHLICVIYLSIYSLSFFSVLKINEFSLLAHLRLKYKKPNTCILIFAYIVNVAGIYSESCVSFYG